MPLQLINQSWEQRGASIDNTDVPWEGISASWYPVTSNSSFIQIQPQMEKLKSLFNKIIWPTIENSFFSAD